MLTAAKTGWRAVGCTDRVALGLPPGRCQRCGRTDLRFVHEARHPVEGRLHVGSECIRRLCFGYAPERQEARLRKLWARRSRWLTRHWATSWRGNETLTFTHEGQRVRVTVIAGKFGGWSYCVAVADEPEYGQWYASADEAKLAAFDRLAERLGW